MLKLLVTLRAASGNKVSFSVAFRLSEWLAHVGESFAPTMHAPVHIDFVSQVFSPQKTKDGRL